MNKYIKENDIESLRTIIKRLKIPPMIKYRHLRNAKGRLFCTVCTIQTLDAKAIGVALCSERDNFSRKYGRDLSKKRADIALLSKRNTLPMHIIEFKYPKEILKILSELVELAEMTKNITVIQSAPPVCNLANHPECAVLVPKPMKSIYIPKET